MVALDLFAGAGALGLEALSRGVARAVFVDNSKSALRTLRKNIDTLGFSESSEVHSGDALRTLDRFARTRMHCGFHWVFVDPPYAGDLATLAIDRLGRGDLLGDDAIVVVEHDRRTAPAPSGCLIRTDERRYGDTVLSFFKLGDS